MSRPPSVTGISPEEPSEGSEAESPTLDELPERPPLKQTASSASEVPYSVFTRSQKWTTVVIVSFAALFSPFTINIYYPAILKLASDMNYSILATATDNSMIFQGLTPGLFAALSDSFGRRPTYIICFVVYVASNIGLAETKTYWLLMLLRAIQATGNSATVALGAGVIADIAIPKERGGYLGIYGVGPLAGPSLGPIIGGALAQGLGWRAIFWFLAIFGGVFAVFLLLLLPETLRSIVGNGSVKPTSVWHKRFIDIILYFKVGEKEPDDAESVVSHLSTLAPKKRTNILESFIIIFQKDVVFILLAPSIFYTIYIMITTSVPPLFEEHYGLSVFHIGLTYIAVGAGALIGTLAWGKRLDRDWKIVEAKYIRNGGKKPKSPTDLINFPLEHARTRTVWYPLVSIWLCTIGYGWTIQYSVHIAVPLIFQIVIGAGTVCIMSAFQALLLDLHPGRSASAAASLNIVRCWMGAGGSAVTQPVLSRLNAGWTYTLLALLSIVCSVPVIVAERRWGMKWRRQREEKREQKKRRKIVEEENRRGAQNGVEKS